MGDGYSSDPYLVVMRSGFLIGQGRSVVELKGDNYKPAFIADVLGDSRPEIITIVDDSIVVYGTSGSLLNRIPTKHASPFAAVCHGDSDDKKDIVVQILGRGLSNKIVCFAASGEVLASWVPPFRFYSFSVVDWLGSQSCLLHAISGQFVVSRLGGERVATLDAPFNLELLKAEGQWISDNGHPSRFVAIASSKANSQRYWICVYSAEGELLYSAERKGMFSCLYVEQDARTSGGIPTFYVGERNRIMKFMETGRSGGLGSGN
jgi:hypothetical protein